MSIKVCLGANDTLYYPRLGGHLWVYLNWALGLRSLGCEVIWLENVRPNTTKDELTRLVAGLKRNLAPYQLDTALTLFAGGKDPFSLTCEDWQPLENATDADLFLNFMHRIPSETLRLFKRSALIDIDPGLLQTWIAQGQIQVTPHDMYFTIGETVGHKDALFPDGRLEWHYTPPCVDLTRWPVSTAPDDAAFSTVSQWYAKEWISDGREWYPNDKRTGFLPYLDLPHLTSQPMELALSLGSDDFERKELEKRGWRVKESHDVTSTPWDYQQYIQSSKGEFSCVKPSCVRFQNAWISDRTLCYLASGKPAVVQHTGPSRFLPDREGLFRFRDLSEAVESLDKIADDYERQARLARELAEQYFDAKKAVGSVLERAVT